jgi:hypothetical protein
MELHPLAFALITYGIAIVISLCVAVIVKIIALIVRRGERSAAVDSAPKDG